MKRRDLLFIAIIIVIAIAGFLFSQLYKSGDAELQVIITVNGEVYQTIPLTEETNEEITVERNGNVNVVHIHDGQVSIEEASCPDQICVYTTPADENGEMIVCLPNQVIVEVTTID